MALTNRQKREWNKRLIAAQEAVEAATEELHQEMVKANDAGLTPYAISLPLGSTSSTVQKLIEAARDPR